MGLAAVYRGVVAAVSLSVSTTTATATATTAATVRANCVVRTVHASCALWVIRQGLARVVRSVLIVRAPWGLIIEGGRSVGRGWGTIRGRRVVGGR
jgi:hypothetical protein